MEEVGCLIFEELVCAEVLEGSRSMGSPFGMRSIKGDEPTRWCLFGACLRCHGGDVPGFASPIAVSSPWRMTRSPTRTGVNGSSRTCPSMSSHQTLFAHKLKVCA
jgi:hypothetical protein